MRQILIRAGYTKWSPVIPVKMPSCCRALDNHSDTYGPRPSQAPWPAGTILSDDGRAVGGESGKRSEFGSEIRLGGGFAVEPLRFPMRRTTEVRQLGCAAVPAPFSHHVRLKAPTSYLSLWGGNFCNCRLPQGNL